ncbi:amino acid synthesis family protein [Anaeroselena agilis]|uniref:Amino acid synthesis family protein n=1 Tax=Anaeroselena agilis TaxID=3063788 RepID=A0ABU3P597_9FIRM|nr:amino acid synthesis family protein [Selenomonadales bacterium 4137-cl]
MEIRKIVTVVEETRQEAGKELAKPTRKVAAAAVLTNPYAGKYVEDLTPLIDASVAIGELLTKKAVEALGIAPEKVESYGKAAIVGTNGELEHAAALLHPKLGTPIRDNVGGGKAILPSTKKVGGPGTAIDVSLGFKNAAYVRTHFDAMEVRIADAPRENEIVLIIALTDSGRPLPRVGGLTVDQVKGEDGLR